MRKVLTVTQDHKDLKEGKEEEGGREIWFELLPVTLLFALIKFSVLIHLENLQGPAGLPGERGAPGPPGRPGYGKK